MDMADSEDHWLFTQFSRPVKKVIRKLFINSS